MDTSIKCEKCKNYIFPPSDTTAFVERCKCSATETKGISGWVCPKCGSGISPYTNMCPCSDPPIRITC